MNSANNNSNPAIRPSVGVMAQKPPSLPVSRRILTLSASVSGSETCAACVLPTDHRRTSRMVPSSAAPKTAKGAIQATRLNPSVVGAAKTVAPYLEANEASISLSLFPAEMPALSSASSCPDDWQPTWLHSPRISAQPQVHI